MNEQKSDPKAKSGFVTLIWLIVGLAPIPILLLAVSAAGASQGATGGVSLLILCVICNLLGGFGCARNVKDSVSRIFLGLSLSGCFFVLCVIVAVFQACAHMQI